jgi:uncharacterized membrane protein YphA (DoxX/SURF4 family)
MSHNVRRYGLIAVKMIVALTFLTAGTAKLAGVEMMVAAFDAVGFGQWFRYLTGVIEIASAILLFVPGLQAIGAGVLVATMTGAVIAHFTVIGPSAVPATILGLLAGTILYAHRDQLGRTG